MPRPKPRPGRKPESNARREIVELCRRLHARNLLAAADGNVSHRLADGTILITPSGRNKALIGPDDLARLAPDGTVLEGLPSGERLMHLEVFRLCPQARWVVHAHPPTAIAWSIARPELRELPCEAITEVILAVGSLPIVPYARPGTRDMGEVLRPFLPRSRVLILARHGALSWGESPEEAYNGMERLEHSAQILKAAEELGGISRLPEPELRALREMRARAGERSL